MRLLIHIGSTKTGSSALQAALFEQRDLLAETGVLYSESGTAASAHHLLAASVHPSAWNLHAEALPEDRKTYFRRTAAAILEEAGRRGCETIIISSEYFWGVFNERVYGAITEAFDGWSPEVVAFIRRPDHWAVSSYLQAVKAGETRVFEVWLDGLLRRRGGGLFFYPILESWRAGLDARKVHVVVYEREAKKNVLKAFCQATGIAGEGLDRVPARVNPSPDADGVDKLLEVNRSDLPEADKRQRRAEIMRGHALRGDRRPFSIDDRIRLRILRATVPSNRQIRRSFTADPQRPLFSEPWPKPPGQDGSGPAVVPKDALARDPVPKDAAAPAPAAGAPTPTGSD